MDDVIVAPAPANPRADRYAIKVQLPKDVREKVKTSYFWIGKVASIDVPTASAEVRWLERKSDISAACFRGVQVPRGTAGGFKLLKDSVHLIVRNAPDHAVLDILTPLQEELQQVAASAEATAGVLHRAACCRSHRCHQTD